VAPQRFCGRSRPGTWNGRERPVTESWPRDRAPSAPKQAPVREARTAAEPARM